MGRLSTARSRHGSSSSVLVEWTPVDGAAFYRLEYWELSDPSVKMAPRGEAIVAASVHRHMLYNCPSGVHLLVRVVACGEDGEVPVTRPMTVRLPNRSLEREVLASPALVVEALLAQAEAKVASLNLNACSSSLSVSASHSMFIST